MLEIEYLDLLVKLPKGPKTVNWVLLLNLLIPGLGLVYAGGKEWLILVIPIGLVQFYFWTMLPLNSALVMLFLTWAVYSIVGAGIVAWTNHQASLHEVKVPDLGGNRALDTLEHKVKVAEDRLKLTRSLELTKPTKVEDLPLYEPTPIVEERPSTLAREIPQFGDGLELNILDKSSAADESSDWEKIAPPAELHVLLSFNNESATTEPWSPPVELESESVFTDSGEQEFAFQSPSECSQFNSEFPSLDEPQFPAPVEIEFAEQISELETDELGSPMSADSQSSMQVSDLASSPESGEKTDAILSSLETQFTPVSPSSDMSPLPPMIADDSVKVDDKKFALSSTQSPQQIQEFFEKLGETVGTSYQQERLSKPSFDISFPSFESQKFSFDFSSALSGDLIAGSEPDAASSKDNCQRCGAARHSEFTFCLGCGISF